MKAFLVRILLTLIFVSTATSYSQEKETPEETLINNKIDSLLNKAVIAVNDLEYDKAIDLLKYSRQLAIRVDHPKRVALTTGTLATLYYQINDFETAESENKKAIEAQIASESLNLLGQSYITAARLALTKDNKSEALEYLNKAEEALASKKRPNLLAQLYILRGDIYQTKDTHEAAVEEYNKAITQSERANNIYLKTQAQVQNATSLGVLGKLKEATQSITEVENALATNTFESLDKGILKAKSIIAEGNGSHKEALDFLKKYHETEIPDPSELYSDYPLPQEKNKQLDAIIEDLNLNIIEENDRAAKALRLTIILAVAIFSILILLILSLYKNNNLRAQANELLQAKNVELVIARDNAEKASVVKAQFLSTITHELRTPMYAVTGLTHLLLTEDPTPSQKKHLDSLKFSGEYLLSLINNILDLNKLEANKVEVEETIFNIKKRIKDVLFALGKSARDKGNKLHLDYDDSIPEKLLGDPVMISQILINLVGNSIKFTRDGDVWIRVRKLTESDGKLSLHFEVEDNGEGISKKKQKTIFQSFTQGSVAINRKFGGTGLGLSIVKNLLGLLNSKITLESNIGEGTKFTFSVTYNLIKQKSGEDNPNISYDIDYQALENRHILVVEDNKINQMITKKILEKNKMTCDTADNGEIAVDKVRNGEFDLILMDIHMPGINGIEATEQIREFDTDIPILALTAVTIDENIDDFYAVGFNDIIPKPYKIEEFFQKIDNGLRNSKKAVTK